MKMTITITFIPHSIARYTQNVIKFPVVNVQDSDIEKYHLGVREIQTWRYDVAILLST